MTPEQREALEALREHGSQRKAAAALGISRASLRDRIERAKRYKDLDGGIKDALEDVGIADVAKVRGGWLKTKSASVRFDMPRDDPADVVQGIRDALEGLDAIKPVPTPSDTNADLLTAYKLADVHIGMMAWGKETGEDYDTSIACDRVQRWISHCVAQSPASDTALILDVGDLNHADDQKNMTPGSGHILDVDTRHFRTIELTIQTIAAAVEIALTKHLIVKVRIMRGNHNPNSYIAVMFALAERYRNEPRVEVIKDPADFFVLQWGKVMIGAHHGDRAKAQNIVLHMADAFPDVWGSTLYRYLYTGHLHHHKSQDIGGVTWEQLRAVTAKDAYAAGYPFSARAEMQATTYHKQRGSVSTQRVANWLDD